MKRLGSCAAGIGVTLVLAGGAHCTLDSNLRAALADAGVLVDGSIVIPSGTIDYEMHLEKFDTSSRTFTKLAAPPTKRNLFTLETAGGKLVVVGGLDTSLNYVSAVDVYDPATGAWNRGAPWPRPRTAQWATVGSLVCALGGHHGTNLAPRRSVECYDVDNDRWTEGDPVPDTVGHYFWPIAVGGKVFVLGSYRSDSSNIYVPYRTAQAYDPVANRWSALADAPAERGASATVLVGTKAYVVGGITSSRDDSSVSDRGMLIYDTVANAWSTAPGMPTSRLFAFGVDAVGSEVLTYFGLRATGPTMDRFSTVTNAWRPATEPATKLDTGVYSPVVHGDRLYLLVVTDRASSSTLSSSGKLWSYDPMTDAWSVVGTRDPDNRDALFYGSALDRDIFFVGAFTTLAIGSSRPRGTASPSPTDGGTSDASVSDAH